MSLDEVYTWFAVILGAELTAELIMFGIKKLYKAKFKKRKIVRKKRKAKKRSATVIKLAERAERDA